MSIQIPNTKCKHPSGRPRGRQREKSGPTTHLAVLGDLDLLHELTQGGTIPGAVLAADSDLLGTLSHLDFEWRQKKVKTIGLTKLRGSETHSAAERNSTHQHKGDNGKPARTDNHEKSKGTWLRSPNLAPAASAISNTSPSGVCVTHPPLSSHSARLTTHLLSAFRPPEADARRNVPLSHATDQQPTNIPRQHRRDRHRAAKTARQCGQSKTE